MSPQPHIPHPEQWRLALAIDRGRLDYALHHPHVDHSLMTGSVPLTSKGMLTAVEDAVYDTPLLLSDYHDTRVLVRAPHFVVLPGQVSLGDAAPLLAVAYPDDDDDEAAVSPLPANGVTIAYRLPRGLSAFARRTFASVTLLHHLAPLCEHYLGLNAGSTIARMFVNLHGTVMDLVVYRAGTLVCANSYPYRSLSDAAYFALSVWRHYGLDQERDELHLGGDGKARQGLAPLLRRYVKYVMPAIVPAAAMRLGSAASATPLELILTALCE